MATLDGVKFTFKDHSVDLVLSYNARGSEEGTNSKQFVKLIARLEQAGLEANVREGYKDGNKLLLLRVHEKERLYAQLYRSRVRDWVHGVRSTEPARDIESSLLQDPLTDAERVRMVYGMLVNDISEGGAGVRPDTPNWKCIEAVFPLHDHAFNKRWIRTWVTKYRLTWSDLDSVRDRFGENTAYVSDTRRQISICH